MRSRCHHMRNLVNLKSDTSHSCNFEVIHQTNHAFSYLDETANCELHSNNPVIILAATLQPIIFIQFHLECSPIPQQDKLLLSIQSTYYLAAGTNMSSLMETYRGPMHQLTQFHLERTLYLHISSMDLECSRHLTILGYHGGRNRM